MATTMAALSSSQIRFAEFVRLTLPSVTETYCNAASDVTVTISGVPVTFTGFGSYLGVSDIQRDIKASSVDMALSLTGIESSNIVLVLGNQIKGAKVEVWRGFLDSNNQIITSPTQQFFKRYQGIVNNVTIKEDFDIHEKTRSATIAITCSSMRLVLESRQAGIKTNKSLWQKFYPNDTSMDRVEVIASTYFDFGKAPTGGGQATPVAPSSGTPETTTESTTQSSNDYFA